ncbi:MAG: hypothetical protein ACPLXM_12075 [Bacteroidales bacterium]
MESLLPGRNSQKTDRQTRSGILHLLILFPACKLNFGYPEDNRKKAGFMLFITSTIASWEQKIHHRQKIFYISPGKNSFNPNYSLGALRRSEPMDYLGLSRFRKITFLVQRQQTGKVDFS